MLFLEVLLHAVLQVRQSCVLRVLRSALACAQAGVSLIAGSRPFLGAYEIMDQVIGGADGH